LDAAVGCERNLSVPILYAILGTINVTLKLKNRMNLTVSKKNKPRRYTEGSLKTEKQANRQENPGADPGGGLRRLQPNPPPPPKEKVKFPQKKKAKKPRGGTRGGVGEVPTQPPPPLQMRSSNCPKLNAV